MTGGAAIGGARALAAMLVAAATTGVCVRALAPSWPDGRAVLRSAVTFAWATLALPLAVAVVHGQPVATRVPPMDAVVTTTLAYGSVALVACRVCRGGAAWAAAALGASLVVLAFEAAALGSASLPEALGAAVRVSLALALCWAMKGRRYVGLRALAHGLVLSSTLAVLLPLGILVLIEGRRQSSWPTPGPLRMGLAAVLVAVAIAVGAVSTAAFVRAGGTPDPLDAPVRVVTGGPYARIRHPLQIAESMLVAASALAIGDAWVVAYAAGFVLFLVGPMRILEQRLLEERLGPPAIGYHATVPAFLPRVSRARLRR